MFKPLETVGGSKLGVTPLDRLISRQVARIGGVRVLDLSQVTSGVSKKRLLPLLLCGAAPDCAKRYGTMLGARFVITGDVAPVGRSQALSLKVVDVSSGRVSRRISGVLPRQVKDDEPALRALLIRLLAPNRYQGRLALSVDLAGAMVLVDGSLVAKTPTKPISLRAGAHAIRVTHPAYHDFVRFVRIPFDKTVRVAVNLKAYPMLKATVGSKQKVITIVKGKKTQVLYRPLPWYRRWYVVTAVAVGAALLVGGITAAAVALSNNPGLGEDGRTSVQVDGRF